MCSGSPDDAHGPIFEGALKKCLGFSGSNVVRIDLWSDHVTEEQNGISTRAQATHSEDDKSAPELDKLQFQRKYCRQKMANPHINEAINASLCECTCQLAYHRPYTHERYPAIRFAAARV